MRLLAALVALGVGAGCSCQPELPDDPNDPDTDTHDDTDPGDSAPVDTAPEPPCDAPEIEPNDALATATPLPMERVGCGDWSEPGDVDYFRFELAEEAWIRVWVDARVLGSFADASLEVLASDGSAAGRDDDDGTTDASLVFPALPQAYDLRLSEQNHAGDVERYFYEVVASVTKAPVDWNREEAEPNDDAGTAELVAHGDVIFGGMKSNIDGDWYRIVVPPGKHTLRVAVEAFALGSGGDFSLMLYDADVVPLPHGCKACAFRGPLGAEGRDPAFQWESSGDEELYFRVFEAEGTSGPAAWYALTITLEAA